MYVHCLSVVYSQVSFDIEVLGCYSTHNDNNTTKQQDVVTFQINRAFPEQVYIFHEIAVKEAHQYHLSYDILPIIRIPTKGRDSFSFQFRWFPSMSYTLGQETCCWSVNNVTITNPYTDNSVRSVRICYDRTRYEYEGKTWVCPVELVGQVTSDAIQFNAENGHYLGDGLFQECTDAKDLSVDINTWNDCFLSNASYFENNSPLFLKIHNEVCNT